ncbi:F0F1 ATP synthase subunit A [Metamycoplasma hyosynoviae]|uniref:F0F1 ATP synthase subunit A n=1 Tax=Metamycoplasma hyosynoviae TaxID=29559 RepID=UPI002359FAA4|nr:F0F1 ATP synthase subunit A [Metamycoplasma hyosynoviae]MDC8911494.1 F0F1 ATP synthase subunit A [Metamycoplasma hyosynoviae]MDD1372089.1 F0F1 ATP synthase subunit A [Metamycoplasma hyosynoviae]
MDIFFEKIFFNSLGNSKINENHIISLSFLIIVTFILSILIYVAVKNQKAEKAPSNAIIMIESLIVTSDEYVDDLSEHKLQKATPYFISLFSFLFLGHLVSLFGFAPMASNISVVLAATAVTWIVTMSLGFIYKKIRFLISLINPIELTGNFTPIISLTFRLFGNIIGGVVLIMLLHFALDAVWVKMIKVSFTETPQRILNPIKVLITPLFNAYLDVFVGAIQAFIFMTLTISYWSQNAEKEIWNKEKNKTEKIKEKLVQANN